VTAADLAARIQAVIDGAAGTVSADDVRHFVQLSLVQTVRASGATSLSPPAKALLADACVRAGVVDADPADAIVRKLDAYFAARPAHPALATGVEKALREALLSGASAGEVGAGFAKWLGQASSTAVLGGGERPPGTAPGGVLGRLAMNAPPAKPKPAKDE
jgi:hypothetical protein